MKRVLVLVSTLLVTLGVSASPVAAAPPDGDPPGDRQTLAVRAPGVVVVGENVEITVVDRESGRPVNRAGVWAIAFRPTQDAPPTAASAAAAGETGVFLGWTGNDGKVVHAFDRGGPYLLAAFKDGHMPGFAWTYAQLVVKQLEIKAPASAAVGEPVTIAVFVRGVGPVPGAGVWALPADAPAATAAARDTVAITTARDDLVRIAMNTGIFLGRTNEDGQVTHKFEKAGGYYLVAAKDGYTPGLGKITIKEPVKQLYIRNPQSAAVGQPVTIGVFERNTGTPVAGAGVWALPAGDLATTSSVREDLADIAINRGIFLGKTDNEGQVTHKFEKAGGYYLVAAKDGYTPGLGKITITPSITPRPRPVPLPQLRALGPAAAKPGPVAELFRKVAAALRPAPDSSTSTAKAVR